jgi:hypothetical protein
LRNVVKAISRGRRFLRWGSSRSSHLRSFDQRKLSLLQGVVVAHSNGSFASERLCSVSLLASDGARG